MPQQAATSVTNNFSKGLLTDFTGLNFPEDACTETYNCIFNPLGGITRRLGFDFESGYTTNLLDRDNAAINYYLWKAVAGDGTKVFLVLQVGNNISFYRVHTSDALSTQLHSSSINLLDYKSNGAPSSLVKTIEIQCTYGRGNLYIVHPYIEPLYVTYDTDLDTFTVNTISIEVRDLDGIYEDVIITDRPTTLTDIHKYNLYNQGWAEYNKKAFKVTNSKLDTFKNRIGLYPSNSDVWWLFKDSNDIFAPATTAANVTRGNSPAPKGFYIVNPFYKDRSNVSGISGLTTETSSYFRPSTIAFHAGRVFFSGVNTEGYNTKIYFSKIIENDRDVGLCYQQNDPTSEDLFDLLPSDGGVIEIAEVGNVLRLWSLGNQLFVFATNGIWAITGSQGLGFTATDYTVTPLSSVNILSGNNFVDVSGIPFWWSIDGIYTITTNNTGQNSINNISKNKIDTFYSNIPIDSKRYVKGTYNPITRIIQWTYRDTNFGNILQRYNFNRILNLDTTSGAIYPWSIGTSDITINGVISIEGIGSTLESTSVIDNVGNTVVANSIPVISSSTVNTLLSPKFKYLVSYSEDASTSYEITFAETLNSNYYDWDTYELEPNEEEAYFITGFKVHGDGIKKFQLPEVRVFGVTNQDNCIYIQTLFDYAASRDSGKFGTKQILRFDDTNFNTQARYVRLRGHGLAAQLKFSSVSNKPFNLSGWSALETINQGS